MGKYDKYFREEPRKKPKKEPKVKKEKESKNYASKDLKKKVKAPKKKNYLKSALARNGVLIFIHTFFVLVAVAILILKLFKKYIRLNINAFIAQYIGDKATKYVIIGILVFGLINLIMLFRNIAQRKKIRRSYCPRCGQPYYYRVEDDYFRDSTLTYHFSNSFRDEIRETWKGYVQFECQHCGNINKIPITFDTHLGGAVTEDNIDVQRAFTRILVRQFEKNKIHMRKK